MAPMPIYDKKHKKKSSPEPRRFLGWILVYSYGDLASTKFVQMMVVYWPFYSKVKFAPPFILMEKMLKNLFLKMYKRRMAETYNIWLKK